MRGNEKDAILVTMFWESIYDSGIYVEIWKKLKVNLTNILDKSIAERENS